MRFDSYEIEQKIYGFFEKYYYWILLIILITAGFNLFYNLGNVPINSWDEARHGVNAYEMIKRNNYIVNTYDYKNDYWNLKPPLSYWAIILGYRIFGYNTLGLRFFSAVAAFICILAVAFFSFRKGGKVSSLITAAILTTTLPYITEHCARTGDADSIFVLFFSLSIICMMMVESNIKWLYFSGLFFSLSFLAKSWHAGNIFIICGVYLIYLIKTRRFGRGALLYLFFWIAVPVFVWFVLRYQQDGFVFFKDMIGYDLAARTSRTLEGHIGTRYYYFEALREWYFYWILSFTGTIFGFMVKLNYNGKKYPVFWYCLFLWTVVPMVLYTIAKTKIWWYILPVYPAFAIITGIAANELLEPENRHHTLKFLIVFLIIISAYKNEALIIEKICNIKPEIAQELIRDTVKSHYYSGRHIYIEGYEQSYVLASELYGDLIPCDGGVEAFIKDISNGPLLVLPKDGKPSTIEVAGTFELLAENEKIYICTK